MKKKKEARKSQSEYIVEYFKERPNVDIPHPEAVDSVTKKFHKLTGKVLRDPDRAIRKLHQGGMLVKVKKGVYRYDPSMAHKRELEDFTPAIKQAIFERDGFECVYDGKGPKDGVEIHADHIKPKELGGEATLENGQTLCARHNFLKKTLGQTETGKKVFIRLYEIAKSADDKSLIKFCTDILEAFEKNDMNGHIVWEK